MIGVHLVTLLGGAAFLALLAELLRRRQLREKYAVLWLLTAPVVAVLAVVPGVLDPLADRLGVQDPVNLVLFLGVLGLLAVCLHLSWECSRLEEETRTIVEELALLRLQVEQLADRRDGGDRGPR